MWNWKCEVLIDKLDTILTAIGVWLLSDAIYSYTLYAHSQSWRGDRQNFANDHWVRVIRALLGLLLIVLGIVIR